MIEPRYREAFEMHAAPEAVEAELRKARAELARVQRYVLWLVELAGRRKAERAAGVWPTGAPCGWRYPRAAGVGDLVCAKPAGHPLTELHHNGEPGERGWSHTGSVPPRPAADDRAHAGLGLPCEPCGGPCRIDSPAVKLGEPEPSDVEDPQRRSGQ